MVSHTDHSQSDVDHGPRPVHPGDPTLRKLGRKPGRDVGGPAAQIQHMPCLEFRVELHEPIDEPLVLFFEVGAGVGPCLLGVVHQFRFKHPLHCPPPPPPCPPAAPSPLPAPARTVGSSPDASSARSA